MFNFFFWVLPFYIFYHKKSVEYITKATEVFWELLLMYARAILGFFIHTFVILLKTKLILYKSARAYNL